MGDIKIIVLVCPASKKKCVKKVLGLYKFFLKALPIDGKANQELTDTVAEILDIARRQVSIVGGHTAKAKRLVISTNLSLEEIEQKLSGACIG